MGNDLVLNILLKANSSSAGSVVRGFAKDLLSIGRSGGVAGVVTSALLVVGTAALAVGAKSVSMAGDFQQAMLENVAGAGLAKDKMDSVSQSVLNMSSVVGRAPTELANALYPLLSGFSAISEKAGKSSLSLQTLKLAFMSVAGSTTNGSDVALAGVQVFNSLRLATGNASTNMARMQTIFDIMNKTVEDGNMKWSAYKNVAGKLATSITGTTITFKEASAAEAALTNQSYSAQSAQTSLSMLFQKMDIQTDTLAKKAKGLGVAFNEQKFKSMTLAEQMAYLNQVTGGSNAKLLALFNGNGKVLRTFLALTSGAKGYAATLADLNTSQGATAAKFATVNQGFNQSMAKVKAAIDAVMISIGLKLLPVVTKLTDAIGPIIANFASWMSSSDGLGAALAPLSNALQGFLTQAQGVFKQVGGWKGIMAALSPTFKQVSDILGGVFAQHMKTAASVSKDLGSWFKSGLMPALKQAMPGFLSLGRAVMGTLIPGFAKLWAIGQSLIDKLLPPLAKMFQAIVPVVVRLSGMIAGGLAAAIKFLMPYVLQATSAFAQFVGEIATRCIPIVQNIVKGVQMLLDAWQILWPHLAPIVAGVWTVIVGVIKMAWAVVSGIIKVGLDLLSGNWKQAWTDVQDMTKGVWDGIVTMFKGYVSIVTGTIHGLVAGIVGLFQGLYNTLVGHSIIPDMINGIIGWFKQLPGRAMSVVTGLVGNLTSALGSLGTTALTWGSNLVGGFITGIKSQLGAVGSAVSSVMSKVSGFLGFHSPSKEGPGREAHLWGPNLIKMFANDIQSSSPRARAAAERMMSQLASAMKGYPDLISKAHMSGNKAQESSLKQQLAMLKTQMNEYKGLVKEMGFAYDQYNPNTPINFSPHHGKRGRKGSPGGGYGTLYNPGGSSSGGGVSSSGGGASSGGTTIYNNYSITINPTIVVPKGTPKEQAQHIYDELDKLMARKQRFQNIGANQVLGAAA